MQLKLISTLIAMLLPGICYSNIFLIQAKRYLDVNSGHYIYPANIVVKGKRIQAINPKTLPEDAKRIKLPESTVLPGLMDMHVHLTFNLQKNYQLRFVKYDASMMTLEGVKNARTMLQSGFTTVRDLGQAWFGQELITVSLAKAAEQNWIESPHIIPAGHALGITGGHMDLSMLGPYGHHLLNTNYKSGIADGIDEVTKAVRYQIKYGAKVIKIGATAGVLSQEKSIGAQQFTNAELKAIVEEAKRHNIFVAAHAHGTEGIINSIKAGVRSIEHGSLLDDEAIGLMKSTGTYLVPTTYIVERIDINNLPPLVQEKAKILLPNAKKSLEKAIKANVKIAFGTDAPVIPFGENAKEFSVLVKRGMTPLQAIQTSTINSAQMMQLSDRGQIKKGLLADLIAVNGDPLQDITTLEHIRWVMRSGKVWRNK